MEPVHIRRSGAVLLAFIVIYGAFITFWTLHELGVMDFEGASWLPIRLFMVGFTCPVFLLFCAMWLVRHRPVLSIFDDRLNFHSGWLLKRAFNLPLADILAVSTNWKGTNSDSPSDLIFKLNSEGLRKAKASRVLKYRRNKWRFCLATVEFSPAKAVEMIRERMRRA